MSLKAFSAMLRPLRRGLDNMVARAIVKLVDDADGMQIVQLAVLDTETKDKVERFQNYGLSTVPHAGAEAVALFVGGHRDHGLVIAVEDRRYRLTGLETGEVALYDDLGSTIVLKRSGDVEITPASGVVSVVGDVQADGISLKTHTHAAGALLTGASAGAPVTGSTGAPS